MTGTNVDFRTSLLVGSSRFRCLVGKEGDHFGTGDGIAPNEKLNGWHQVRGRGRTGHAPRHEAALGTLLELAAAVDQSQATPGAEARETGTHSSSTPEQA